MKKFKEILKDIDITYAKIKSVKEEIDKINSYWRGLTFKEIKELRDEGKSKMAETAELEARKRDLNLTLNFLKNNAKISLFNEVMPVVLEVFGKYAGKSYGPKIQEKIRNEIKERINCSVWIDNGFHVIALNENGYNVNWSDFTCNSKLENGERKSILIDNKIQKLKISDLELWYINENYIEDIPATIEKIKELKREAAKKQEELRGICDKFNELTVDGIERIYCDKRIYDRF